MDINDCGHGNGSFKWEVNYCHASNQPKSIVKDHRHNFARKSQNCLILVPRGANSFSKVLLTNEKEWCHVQTSW